MKPHRTDGVSLTFAVIFLAITAWWLVGQLLDLPQPALGWLVAGGLILLGVLGLIGALRSAGQQNGRSAGQPGEPATGYPDGPNAGRLGEPAAGQPVGSEPAGPRSGTADPRGSDLA